MGLQRRLKGVYMGAPHCKAVFGRKFSKSRQNRAQKWRFFRKLRGVNVKFLSPNPEKANPCAEPRRLTYCAPSKHFDAQFRATGKRNPWRDRD